MSYYPKEYALRELTQLYSFTGLKVIQNHPHTEKEVDEQHNIHHDKQNTKPTTIKTNTKTPDQKIPQKERKKRKMIEKITGYSHLSITLNSNEKMYSYYLYIYRI